MTPTPTAAKSPSNWTDIWRCRPSAPPCRCLRQPAFWRMYVCVRSCHCISCPGVLDQRLLRSGLNKSPTSVPLGTCCWDCSPGQFLPCCYIRRRHQLITWIVIQSSYLFWCRSCQQRSRLWLGVPCQFRQRQQRSYVGATEADSVGTSRRVGT